MESHDTAPASRGRLADFIERVAAPLLVAAIVGLTTAAFRLAGSISAVEHELTRCTDSASRREQVLVEHRDRLRELEADSRRVGERDAEMRARIDSLERRVPWGYKQNGMSGNGMAQ